MTTHEQHHDPSPMETRATRALQELLAGRLPAEDDTKPLTGDVKACVDALTNALQADGVQAVRKSFIALAKDRPWLNKLAASPLPASGGTSTQQQAAGNETSEPRYQLHRLSYFQNLPKREWNVEGIIRDKGTSVFFGDGGCGKSAVVLSMMLHKAYGLDWFGPRKVKKGLVVWVAAEGEDEIYPRASAWLLHHGIQEEPNILYIDEVVPLNDGLEVDHFIARLQQQLTDLDITEPITSIVFDTYAECSPGADENDTREAKLIAASIHHIRKTFDTHIAVIHHVNAGGRMRGSTVLRDYVNTAIKVTKEAGGLITLHCDKQRGAPDFPDIHLRLLAKIISDDPHDTAPVIVSAEAPTSECSASDLDQKILEVLKVQGKLGYGKWRDECIALHGISASSFYTHVKALVESKRVLKQGGKGKGQRSWYSLPEQEPEQEISMDEIAK